MNKKTFNENIWCKKCEIIANDANLRCGLSYEHYIDLFSAEIDNVIKFLPLKHHLLIISIARSWDYTDKIDREKMQAWNSENDYCVHGIKNGCCPAGCGSY